MATVVSWDIRTGKKKVLASQLSIQAAEREKEYHIKRIYDTDKYDDFVIYVIQ